MNPSLKHFDSTLPLLSQLAYCQTHGLTQHELLTLQHPISTFLLFASTNYDKTENFVPFFHAIISARNVADYITAYNTLYSLLYESSLNPGEQQSSMGLVKLFLEESFSYSVYLKQALYNLVDFSLRNEAQPMTSPLDFAKDFPSSFFSRSSYSRQDLFLYLITSTLPTSLEAYDYGQLMTIFFQEYRAFPFDDMKDTLVQALDEANKHGLFQNNEWTQTPLAQLYLISEDSDITPFAFFYERIPLTLLGAYLPAVIPSEVMNIAHIDSNMTLQQWQALSLNKDAEITIHFDHP